MATLLSLEDVWILSAAATVLLAVLLWRGPHWWLQAREDRITGAAVETLTLDDGSELVDGMSSQFNGQDVVDKFGSPSGTKHIIAMSLKGKFKTAFPDGKPAAADSDDEAEKTKDDSNGEHLSESSEENSVLLVGDTDLLVNDYSVRVQRTIFGNTAQMINGNLAFIGNAVEKMGGNSNLITIRSREDQNRPFEKINEMQQEAQKNFDAQLKTAQETLQNIVAAKSKLEQNNNQEGNQVR